MDVRYIPSENCNDRPERSDAQEIELLVVHGISLPPAEFGGTYISDLFTNQLDPAAHPYFKDIAKLRVSSHILIRRDGEVVQFVPFHRRAWHAGISRHNGRDECNDFSIGIELEGTDDIAYTDAQYAELSQLIRCLLKNYPNLHLDNIVGHSDIAPGRKTDPGASFDWPRLRHLLAE